MQIRKDRVLHVTQKIYLTCGLESGEVDTFEHFVQPPLRVARLWVVFSLLIRQDIFDELFTTRQMAILLPNFAQRQFLE